MLIEIIVWVKNIELFTDGVMSFRFLNWAFFFFLYIHFNDPDQARLYHAYKAYFFFDYTRFHW